MPMCRCRLAGALLLTVGLATAFPRAALAQGTITFTSKPIAAFGNALASGPDGSLWFVNQGANTVGRVTFPDRKVTTFNVPTANAGLASITAGPDGRMWFTESTAKKIGRIDPSGTFAEFPTPGGSPPPQRIFPGPNGTLWSTSCTFFEPQFFGCGNFIVTTTAGTSTFLTTEANSFSKSFGADGCALGADGNAWCFGIESVQNPFSSVNKIARITPTGGYASFAPPTSLFHQGFAIVGAPDGNVWYTWKSRTDFATGVARITPTGVITEYTIATGNTRSQIFGLAVGFDGNLIFVDRGTSKLYRLVLSTAAGTGQPTINSGTISASIPEDLVIVSNQAGASSDPSPKKASGSCSAPIGEEVVDRSGGSPTDGLEEEEEETEAPATCTDMYAAGAVLRALDPFVPRVKGFTGCGVWESPHRDVNLNDAINPTIELRLPGLKDITITKQGQWAFCDVSVEGSNYEIVCTSPRMAPDQYFQLEFQAVVASPPDVGYGIGCLSDTPEIFIHDNAGLIEPRFEEDFPPDIPIDRPRRNQ